MFTKRAWHFAILLAVLTFMVPRQGRASLQPPASRQAAPDFSAKQFDGPPIQLSDYRGRVVLLDFWATWCRPCKAEVPWYIEMQSKYGDRGLSVVGIAMDESWTPVWPFVLERKVNYRIVLGDSQVGGLYKVHEMPVAVLIDKSGRVADVHVGVLDREQFEKEVQALLQE